LPIVVCAGGVTENTGTAIKEMTKRNLSLSRALIVSEIGEEYTKQLHDAGVVTEEVTV